MWLQDMPICGTKTVNMSTCQDVNVSICGTETSKYLDFFACEAIRSVTHPSVLLPAPPKIDHFRIGIPKGPDVTITYYLHYFSHVLVVPRPPKNRCFGTLNRLQSHPRCQYATMWLQDVSICGPKTCQYDNMAICQYVNMWHQDIKISRFLRARGHPASYPPFFHVWGDPPKLTIFASEYQNGQMSRELIIYHT